MCIFPKTLHLVRNIGVIKQKLLDRHAFGAQIAPPDLFERRSLFSLLIFRFSFFPPPFSLLNSLILSLLLSPFPFPLPLLLNQFSFSFSLLFSPRVSSDCLQRSALRSKRLPAALGFRPRALRDFLCHPVLSSEKMPAILGFRPHVPSDYMGAQPLVLIDCLRPRAPSDFQ